jgi:hypothetical protein
MSAQQKKSPEDYRLLAERFREAARKHQRKKNANKWDLADYLGQQPSTSMK